jgi:hypothetical protein
MTFAIGFVPIFRLRIRIERIEHGGAYIHVSLLLFKLGFYFGLSIAD